VPPVAAGKADPGRLPLGTECVEACPGQVREGDPNAWVSAFTRPA
jgi:hypothetical protein